MCGIGCESLLLTKIAVFTSFDTSTLLRTREKRKSDDGVPLLIPSCCLVWLIFDKLEGFSCCGLLCSNMFFYFYHLNFRSFLPYSVVYLFSSKQFDGFLVMLNQ